MVFGEGKYHQRCREQYRQLAGDEPIPVSVLQDRLREQRQSLDMTEAQIQAVVNSIDLNKDKVIDYAEFERLMASPLGQSTRMKRVMRTLASGVIAPSQKLEVNSYIEEYNCFPPPIFILTITIIEVGVFFMYYFNEKPPRANILTHCAGCHYYVENKPIPGPFVFVPEKRAEVWRFASYMFMHAGLTHLLGNIIMQLILGIPLEIVHKLWRIGPLYVLSVVAGSLLQYSLDPRTLLVGASAGVYALITAHLANVVINWAEMPFRFIRLGVFGTYLVVDIGMAVYRRVFADECDTVSHSAHIAGGITGFCFGVFILYNIVEHKWERVVRWVCAVVLVLFFVVMISMTIFRSPSTQPFWANCAAKKG